VAGLLAGIAAWLLVGGWIGAVLGVVAALGTPVAVARLEPAAVRRRRLALHRAAPLVADLLAAALAAGVPLERAVPVVARAVGGPAEALLRRVHDLVRLGEPAPRAWAKLAHEPGLGPIARCVARSARTGAPLAALLTTTAGELRAASAAAAMAEVRAVSVRAVLPLGLCLLPAFTLLGIVPVVVGLLRGV
jgi:Flp pilus assembly protein TadB